MAHKLPGEAPVQNEIVDHLFPHLSEDDRRKIVNLFDHAYDHGWADEELQDSIIGNICRENGIEKPPAEWDEQSDDDEE